MRDEEIIGGVRFRVLEDNKKAKIGPLMIKREHQGQGYGQQVMNMIKKLSELSNIYVGHH